MTTRAAFWGVSRWSVTGSRGDWLAIRVLSTRGGVGCRHRRPWLPAMASRKPTVLPQSASAAGHRCRLWFRGFERPSRVAARSPRPSSSTPGLGVLRTTGNEAERDLRCSSQPNSTSTGDLLGRWTATPTSQRSRRIKKPCLVSCVFSNCTSNHVINAQRVSTGRSVRLISVLTVQAFDWPMSSTMGRRCIL